MSRVVYLDGEWVAKEEAKISVFDHGLLYGDGAFEGIRAYNGRVFRLREHIDRLYASAQTILLDIPLSKEEMMEATLETLRRNNLSDAYIRLVVTRGPGDLGLDPRKCLRPTVFIITESIELYPPEYYAKGLEIITVATRRNLPTALDPSIKSLNYLNNILAKIEVIQAGVLEGLMLNAQGYVAEATGDNIFLVHRGELITPPISAGILPGITRAAVMELAQEEGISVREELFTQHFVYNAEECFLTGTAAEVIPVVKVDGRTIGSGRPGPITRRLMRAFRELTQREGVPIRG
ncbi:MAG TPA: branched-chain-amino-acid transaminase [Armatimonadetes bacterium]|nr:branched-chain-amino-acid transaminase [Armatimonadota bacterium]